MSDHPRAQLRNASFRQLRSGLARGMLVVGFFSCICNVLMLTTPIYMLQMFDRVLSSRNLDTLILLTVIAGFALITLATLMVVRSAILIRLGVWFDRQVGSAAILSVISSATRSGKVPSSRVLGDLSSVRRSLSKSALLPLFDAPWAPIFLLIVFLLSPVLGGVALTGLVFMLLIAIGHDRIVLYIAGRSSTLSRPANDQAKTLLRNADVAQSMGMVPTLLRTWAGQSGDALALQANKEQARATYSATTQFVTQGLRVAMLCVGAILVIENSVSTGVMLAAAILASRAIAPMTGIVKAWRTVAEAYQAYTRLKNDLECAPERQFSTRFYLPDGGLSVQRVGFRYAKTSSRVSRNVSVELEPGEILCVDGPPGAGKSTLAKLIAGILQARTGHVLLGGSPVDDLAPDVRAEQIGYLPPELQLFDGTIHENISRMRLGVEQSVVEAAQLAGVHDAILGLPDGYDTRIVNGETTLSPGELQLVSIARAIFGSPRLLVLDEPTSRLDKSYEQSLVNVLRTLKDRGTIMVIVTHRAIVLRSADRILRMPEGKVSFPSNRENVSLKVVQDGPARLIGRNSRKDDV